MAKKKEALDRLAAMGAALPASKTTAAGVTVRKGPGGRPKRYLAGIGRFSVYMAQEDKEEVERFTLWLSARDGKRYTIADAFLLALRDSKIYHSFTAGK